MAPGRRQPGAWRCPGLRTGSHGSSRERWRRWRERRLEGGFGGQGVKSRGASEATRVATEDWASGEHWKSGPCLVWTPEPGSFKNLWPGPGPLGLRARGGDRFRDTQTEVRCGELRPHAPRPLRQGRGFLGSGRCSAESLALSPHGTDAIPELGRRTRLRGTLLPVLAVLAGPHLTGSAGYSGSSGPMRGEVLLPTVSGYENHLESCPNGPCHEEWPPGMGVQLPWGLCLFPVSTSLPSPASGSPLGRPWTRCSLPGPPGTPLPRPPLPARLPGQPPAPSTP